jgi:hypothetical protein
MLGEGSLMYNNRSFHERFIFPRIRKTSPERSMSAKVTPLPVLGEGPGVRAYQP